MSTFIVSAAPTGYHLVSWTNLPHKVIHWPVSFPPGALFTKHATKPEIAIDPNGPSLVETWKAMIKLTETGKVRCDSFPVS